MATYKEVLAKAAGELGNGGGKYWRYFGYNYTDITAPAWCCMFQDWLFDSSGMSIGQNMNCLTIQTGMKNAGWTQVAKASIQAGDVVIFEWDKAGNTYDHIGICEAVISSSTIQCIEGNVSKKVGRRTRDMKYVRQVWRPNYSSDTKSYTGWYWKDEKCYHYTNGQLDKDKWFEGTGKWSGKYFYVGSEGYAVTNQWEKCKDVWYYCGSNGWPVSDTWESYKGKWYYLGSDCKPVFDYAIEYDGKCYFLHQDGAVEIKGIIEKG